MAKRVKRNGAALGVMADHPEAHAVVARIARGEAVSDREFDGLFPKAVQKLSRTHWTPVAVAIEAAAWLAERPGSRVLDVGSGAGKLCLIGAVTTAGRFTGVERHSELVEIARSAAEVYRISAARFVASDAMTIDWREFGSVYLYNPFAVDVPMDAKGSIEGLRDAWLADALQKLAGMPVGTRVVVYVGLGAPMPATYQLLREQKMGRWSLSLWVKGGLPS